VYKEKVYLQREPDYEERREKLEQIVYQVAMVVDLEAQ
tara:strand:- start:712 stop:825 length:114 start_codon:yes stop_codon:yes gene_type:complete